MTGSPDAPLRRAVALARKAMRANTGGPFGAVVVRDGKIVGEGVNAVTSTNDPTAHAEVMAIRSACERLQTFNLSDCEIVTTCEPCPMCLGAIYWARLARITYGSTRGEAAAIGFDDDFIYREIAAAPATRRIPATQMPTAEADALFAEWTTKPDKTRY